MATQITATLPTLAFPREVDYPTQEDWAAFSAAAELNFGILGGTWSTQMQLWKNEANTMSIELNNNATITQGLANYQGDWISQGYTLGQTVSVSGIYYVCKLTHATGQNPTDIGSLYWNLALGNWNLKVNTDMSGYTSKTTPADADLLPLSNSAAGFEIKKLSWANLKTTLFASPAFTGNPTAPTPAPGDYGNRIATTEFVVNSSNSENTYQGAYGISWDYTTDTYIRTGAKGYTSIQSKMKRCVVKPDGTVNYYLHPDNSNFKEDGAPSILTGADGNVMVEIPKHYVKVDTVGNVDSFSISLTQETGYVLDPSFMKWNGTTMVEVPYRYFRAYEGYVSGGKLLSVSGVIPTRSQTISTFRTQATANGAGWHLTDWNLLNTIKRLCYIEFCDFIVTKYLGNGNDTGSDFGITTGQSNALGNRSSNSTHNNMYMSYRGIENMYADIWEFVDGININNYQAYVNQKWSTFASDVFTGDYVAKGQLIASGASSSLIKRCNVSVDGGFIPTTIGGSTTTFYGDALWSDTGARIALYGGDASSGASAGLGALSMNPASSNSNTALGAAVCR